MQACHRVLQRQHMELTHDLIKKTLEGGKREIARDQGVALQRHLVKQKNRQLAFRQNLKERPSNHQSPPFCGTDRAATTARATCKRSISISITTI